MQVDAFVGTGALHFDRLTAAGASTGYKEVGNADQFEVSPDAEIKEKTSKRPENYGQVVASVSIPKPTKISVKLTDFNADTLAMQLMATKTEINQAAGTFTDLPMTAKLGKGVDIGRRNLTDVGFTVKSADGVTTYVKDTDYTVNWAVGLVTALADGSILEGASLKVSGSALAYTGAKLSVGSEAQIKAHLLLDGKNLSDGRTCRVFARNCVFKPTGSLDFLKDDFGEIAFEGTVASVDVEYLD